MRLIVLILLAATLGAAAPPEPAPPPFPVGRELRELARLRPPLSLWLVRPVPGAPLLVDLYEARTREGRGRPFMVSRYRGRLERRSLRWGVQRCFDPQRRQWFEYPRVLNPPRP